jgi:Ca2+-binding EF-hand superfamily protein
MHLHTPVDRAAFEEAVSWLVPSGGITMDEQDELQSILSACFDLFDIDKDGYIDASEFLSGVQVMMCGSGATDDDIDARLAMAFRMIDADGNGSISPTELQEFFQVGAIITFLAFATKHFPRLTIHFCVFISSQPITSHHITGLPAHSARAQRVRAPHDGSGAARAHRKGVGRRRRPVFAARRHRRRPQGFFRRVPPIAPGRFDHAV